MCALAVVCTVKLPGTLVPNTRVRHVWWSNIRGRLKISCCWQQNHIGTWAIFSYILVWCMSEALTYLQGQFTRNQWTGAWFIRHSQVTDFPPPPPKATHPFVATFASEPRTHFWQIICRWFALLGVGFCIDAGHIVLWTYLVKIWPLATSGGPLGLCGHCMLMLWLC